MKTAAVVTKDLRKVYGSGDNEVHALAGVSLDIPAGEFVVVRGRSGSGKTTLMHLLAALDRPTSGIVAVGGIELQSMSEAESARFRRRNVGVIYQFFNLVPTLGIEHNIALPLLIDGERPSTIRPKIKALVERLGIGHRMGNRVEQLSGGEMQRVAIARSLIADPVLVLADEPTGNLDTFNASEVLSLFSELNRERQVTFVMMTHDPEAASYADRVIVLSDGQVESDTARVRE